VPFGSVGERDTAFEHLVADLAAVAAALDDGE